MATRAALGVLRGEHGCLRGCAVRELRLRLRRRNTHGACGSTTKSREPSPSDAFA